MRLDVLTTQESAAWLRTLEACAPYDFYQLPEYHTLAEEMGEGAAQLFVYTEGDHTIALPLLLRPLDGELAAGWEPGGTGWRDATSVYGYAGPICSSWDVPDTVIQNFQAALLRQLRDLQVVSVFSRLHPLFPQRPLLAGLGDLTVSRTVSIDLTLPADVQRSQIRHSHRTRINKLRREGLTCVKDPGGSRLEDFCGIYYETMRRVNASQQYFFSPKYFERLRGALGSRLHLFFCLRDGKAISGGLFIACHGILQYHLGGTLDEALALAPMKLLVDEVRLWATGQGLREFHLGGGTTPDPGDSLLSFKEGFSNRTHEFAAWRWVVFPEIYQRLCEEKVRRDERHQSQASHPHFFPAYRCPTVLRAQPAMEPLAGTSPGGCP